MIRNIFFCLSLLCLFSNVSHAQNKANPYKTLYYLNGYKCMTATTNINDMGNAPSPKVYDGSEDKAKIIGDAILTVLVNTRVPQINNRQAILTASGTTGWVDIKYLHPVSEPCYAILMANGRHGFDSAPPKRKYNN